MNTCALVILALVGGLCLVAIIDTWLSHNRAALCRRRAQERADTWA